MKRNLCMLFLAIAMIFVAIVPAYAVDSASSTHLQGSYGFRSALSKNITNVVFSCHGEFTSYPSGLSTDDIGATLYLSVGSNPMINDSFWYPSTSKNIQQGSGSGPASSAEMYVDYYLTNNGSYTAHISWDGSTFTVYS